MSCYRRPFQTGATIFFTVNIADRGQSLLTDQISLLRKSVKEARQDRPFRIDAWVVMPDHMHCVWTLPEGVTKAMRVSGSAGFGNIISGTNRIMRHVCSIVGKTR